MPITLITGLPGHGKGIYSLDTVNKLEKISNRPVYYHNVTDLNLKWHKLENAKDWINCPEGSIILLDEAWQTFPLRPNAQTPPDYVAMLATHRHKGFDIFIVTQQPSQLDTFVRKLVDHHYHVIRKYGAQSANVHQFIGLNSDPQRSRKNSIKHSYNYPKEVYGWYKSAEVHTIQTKRPMRIYFLWFGVPLILATSIYFINHYLNPRTGKIAEGIQTDINGQLPEKNGLPINSSYQQQKPIDWFEQQKPRVSELPQTAPKYDELTKPTRVPTPAACIASKTRCVCVTNQGTKYNTLDSVCRQIVKDGFFKDFDDEKSNNQNLYASQSNERGVLGGASPMMALALPSTSLGLKTRASPSN